MGTRRYRQHSAVDKVAILFVATWSGETERPATRVVGWLDLAASKYFT